MVNEKFYIGKFAASTFDVSQVLADAEVLIDGETQIRARIDSQKGLALTRLGNRRAWHVWHVDLRQAFDNEAEATAAARQKMNAKPANGEKLPLWAAFPWPDA